MKVIIQLIALILLVAFLSACGNMKAKTTEEILENRQMRSNIMSAITNDSTMMIDMMDHLMENEHSMKMMSSNQDMLKKMVSNKKAMMSMLRKDTAITGMMMENMMNVMGNDTMICNKMCGMMKYDKHMMGMMWDKNKESKTTDAMTCSMHNKSGNGMMMNKK